MWEILKKRIGEPIVALLKQGITPEKVGLSIAFGLILGVFPVIGLTSLLCAVVGYIFRLNQVAIQVVNYAIYPVQIMLLVPFCRLGEFVTRSEAFPVSPTAVLAMLEKGILLTLTHFWSAILHAILGWGIISIPIGFLFYVSVIPLLRKAARTRES